MPGARASRVPNQTEQDWVQIRVKAHVSHLRYVRITQATGYVDAYAWFTNAPFRVDKTRRRPSLKRRNVPVGLSAGTWTTSETVFCAFLLMALLFGEPARPSNLSPHCPHIENHAK